jgi:hypothetical protein
MTRRRSVWSTFVNWLQRQSAEDAAVLAHAHRLRLDPFYSDLPRRAAVNEAADDARRGPAWIPRRRDWLR